MPGMLKLTLALVFHLKHHDDLGLGLPKFVLGQHTSSTRKLLKAWSNQHQGIASGSATLSLAGVATLTAPDCVSLPATLPLAWGDHA